MLALGSLAFASPWVLAALAALPVIWWLLRVTPPAPHRLPFPAIRLLFGLKPREETPARTPWWLLALRILAAALVIIALAGPVIESGSALPGSGPVLLVMDNGWASAADWPKRIQAANVALDRAAHQNRRAALLATAPTGTGAGPAISPVMEPDELRSRLATLHPEPWPADRPAAAAALAGWTQAGTAVVYVADGLTDGSGFSVFEHALTHVGSVREVCCAAAPPRLMLAPESQPDRLIVRVAQPAQAVASKAIVLAQSGDGRTLAQVTVDLPAGATTGSAPLVLPPEVRNRLARLMLQDAPSAGSVALLDERWRRRPVGLTAGDQASADAPFVGSLYFARRALAPYTEIHEGALSKLLDQGLSVLVLADDPLPAGPDRDAVTQWVEKGGTLIRFAGPRTAEAPVGEADTLLPVKLIGGDRGLGGAMSWGEPAKLAAFPPSSPFNGLPIPDDVTISRQVLAEPAPDLPERTWARLADGTPLVTEAPRGSGRIILFHVTADSDWSNLPLSGLFVDMLRRLVALSAGIATPPEHTILAPAETLDGFGVLSSPPPAASGLPADQVAQTIVSPQHPPGLYGPENGREALNLSPGVAPPEPAPAVAGARVEQIGTTVAGTALGPWLMAGALLLLALDMAIGLLLRGLLRVRRIGSATAALLLLVLGAGLVSPGPRAQLLESNGNPALATRLAYITSGDTEVDSTSRQGLEGLSVFVNERTAAALDEPDAVTPGTTDLSFYPLLYWPITAEAQPLSERAANALNDYMARGGIILIDTRASGSGAGFAPGTDAALKRVAKGLVIPSLKPLTIDHVLARAFYLLRDYPGRYEGGTVWVQSIEDRANDSVSPVIIGGNDWAAAWAVDRDGRSLYATIPGGPRQRTLAFRFGVNLVMYALTGNYKGDQVQVPAILQRLGQ
jgi:uncharacterized protein DUF4159/aerotolerance regulator-like protein